MTKLSFFAKLWICRSILHHSLTICAILSFSNDLLVPKSPAFNPKTKPTKIYTYWNIPTFQCDTHKLNFTILAEKFGIIQNRNDRFWGNEINILYDPGNFPALLKNGKKTVIRNGGVPQRGNLTDHLEVFQRFLDQMIPDRQFAGIGVIDFESWRPIFRQNFGTLIEYKTLSISIAKQQHPIWFKQQIENEAARQFEINARKFMEQTLITAKNRRPNATWGYYGFPHCFNKSPSNTRKSCPKEVSAENDRIRWLFQVADNLHPSLYLGNLKLNSSDKVQLIEGRIEESLRLIKSLNTKKSIIPYFWYKYHDTKEFVSKQDLFSAFTVLSSSNINGLVLWGSSDDVNTKKKCLDLYKFIENTLGPLITFHF